MFFAIYLSLFVLGLIFGSFLGAYITRYVRDESIVKGRSHCDFCKHRLSWFENIPLLSWTLQKGRCRHCKEFLGFFYPTIELTSALVFVGLSLIFIDSQTRSLLAVNFVYLPLWLIVACSLIIVFFTDLKYGLIPDSAVVTGVLATLTTKLLDVVVGVWSFRQTLLDPANQLGGYLLKTDYFSRNVSQSYLFPFGLDITTALIVTLFFLFLVVITKGKGMGLGDVKFAFLLGLLCGFPKAFVAVFLAFIVGAAYSVVLIILKRKTLKQTIHFGPFLVLSIPAALLFGDVLLRFYLRI